MEQLAVSRSCCCRMRRMKLKSSYNSPPDDPSPRSSKAEEVAGCNWSPWLWRLRRWELSYQRLLMSASPRMGDTTRMRQRRTRPRHHPARESGRFGLHAETGRVGVWARFNPACRKTIPTHCLYCCCGALRALASLSVCLPVCLHGETCLPSSMLQACQMLFQYFRLFLEVTHH